VILVSTSAFGQIKVTSNSDLQIPNGKDIRFVDGGGNNQWGIEYWNGGLNFLKFDISNYVMFMKDTTVYIGTPSPVNSSPSRIGRLQINGWGLDGGLGLYSSRMLNGSLQSLTTLRMFVYKNNNAYIVRAGNLNKGIVLNASGHVGINGYASENYWLFISGDAQVSALYTTSDARCKTGITDLDADNVNKLYNLNAKKFHLKYFNIADSISKNKDTSEVRMQSETVDSIVLSQTLEKPDVSREQFGFIAQDVENIFPELVKVSEDGGYSMNYIGLIPIIVESMKLQKTEIDSLKGIISSMEQQIKNNTECCTNTDKSKTKSGTESETILSTPQEIVQSAYLDQNKPNPFSENTIIGMYLPEQLKSATLYVYNVNGLQLLSKTIPGRSKTSVTISAKELQAGIYIYSLIVDGVLVGSRQMILTE